VTAPEEPPPMPSPNDFVGTMIPTGNKPGLLAYYLGLFSLIPCLGVVLGIQAIYFGVKGVRLASRHPEVRGGAHAWSGIVMGGLSELGHLVGIVWLLTQKSGR
jgi:hypothetical protein